MQNFSQVTGKIIYICGDFNINLLNSEKHPETDDFLSTMYSMSLYPSITKPSRITSSSATLIDNIFTNDIQNESINGLFICDVTDHLPVFTIKEWKCWKKPNLQITSQKHLLNEQTIGALFNALSEQDWGTVYNEENVDNAYNNFIQTFIKLYNKYCPLINCKNRKRYEHCPWLTKGLQNACKKKNNLYAKFIKLKTKESEIKYKTYKNKLTDIIRNSKKHYYKNILEENKNNPRKVWGVLNTITNKGTNKKEYPEYFIDENRENYNMQEIVSRFNEFFVKVGPELAAKIPDTGSITGTFQIDRCTNTMFLTPVDETEVINIVGTFKNKSSTDCYGLNMALVKKIILSISKPLTYLSNLSFSKGSVPKHMKTAKISPIYKCGDRHVFTNYRPVSLLPQFSKILERLFDSRLETFMDKHSLLNENQYGFRKRRSTTMAVLDAVEEISLALDRKQYAVGVFVDLKKAFDTLDHTILLRKLEMYGIRGIALKWLESYLTDRQQFVKMGNQASGVLNITCGVPQGSILGPKLFNLYINDIFNVSKIVKMILFADDTNIFYSNDDYNELIANLNSELNKLKHWMNANKLSLNMSKTKIMSFGNKNTALDFPVRIDNSNIERVSEIKFLGITIDEKLSWKPHIRHTQSKVSKSISIINRVKFSLEYNALFTLYNALVSLA